jgi:hypothetical protein
LPSDAEWEWAARAGTRTLFWHGNRPPDDFEMGRSEANEDPYPNPLGLRGLGWLRELCAPATIRGGAQDLVPWQSTGELVLMLSAYKTVENVDHGVVRPARDIPRAWIDAETISPR